MTHIPAQYIGTQHWPAGTRYPSLPLYNLLVDIPGHPAGSTVSLYTLWREGYHPVEKEGRTMKYKCVIPYQDDMGSIGTIIVSETPMETKEEQALWHFNSMRRHDGLEERSRLPRGVKFTHIEE